MGGVGVSRNHLLTEVPVRWTGCFNMCRLRWEGSEERAAVDLCPSPVSPTCHSQPLPVEAVPPSLLWCDSSHPSIPAVELQLEEPDSDFPARPGIVLTHVLPAKKNMSKESSCAVGNVSLKNGISSWSSDLSTGLDMSTSRHHSLVFGRIVLLGWVKKQC